MPDSNSSRRATAVFCIVYILLRPQLIKNVYSPTFTCSAVMVQNVKPEEEPSVADPCMFQESMWLKPY